MRAEVPRRRPALAEFEVAKDAARLHSGGACRPRTPAVEARQLKAPLRALRPENRRLGQDLAPWRKAGGESLAKVAREKARAERLRASARQLSREPRSCRRELGCLRHAATRARSLSGDVAGRRDRLKGARAGQGAKAGREAADARLAGRRTARQALSKKRAGRDGALRRVLLRARRQQPTLTSLAREHPGLRRAVKGARGRSETLEAALAQLRSTRATLSRRRYGRPREQQDKPRSRRPRRQQRGAPGHGRPRRPGLEERPAPLPPPENARGCPCCGQTSVANGADESPLVEIKGKAHRRVIQRPRWRRAGGGASAPKEVWAPPPPRRFRGPLSGPPFWTRFLCARFACPRPLHRGAAGMAGHGLVGSPGPRAHSPQRVVPRFPPLAAALRAPQHTAGRGALPPRPAVAGAGTAQARPVEPRRAVALGLPRRGGLPDRPVAPRRSGARTVRPRAPGPGPRLRPLQRLQAARPPSRRPDAPGRLREPSEAAVIDGAAGQGKLPAWGPGGSERIAALSRLHEARLKPHAPARPRRTPGVKAAQARLEAAREGRLAEADRPRAGRPDGARASRAGRARLNQREGRGGFLDRSRPPPPREHPRRKAAQGASERKTALVRLRQRDRRPARRPDILRHRHTRLAGPHRPARAPGRAGRLREQRRQAAGSPGALAAVGEGRGGSVRLPGGGMTGAVEGRWYGRAFTTDDMTRRRALSAPEPPPPRAALSRECCRRLGWLKPASGLKDLLARVPCLALPRAGLSERPPPTGRRGPPRPLVFGPAPAPPPCPPPQTLAEGRPLDCRPGVHSPRAGQRWNEFGARAHSLGRQTRVGAQRRYAVHARNGWPGALRGCSPRRRAARPARPLHRMGTRGARAAPPVRRRPAPLPDPALDREPQPRRPPPRPRPPPPAHRRGRALHQPPPVLIETVGEPPRATGAVDKAAGWTRGGTTQGRGRYDRPNQRAPPQKNSGLRTLRKNWQPTLNPYNGSIRPGTARQNDYGDPRLGQRRFVASAYRPEGY